MTTFEHAMLGVNGVLATGLFRRYGWQLVAVAGFAAIAPDWDGLPMLVDMGRFEHGHRVWGHNILACFLLAILIGVIDYRFDVCSRVASRFVRFGPFRESEPFVKVRSKWNLGGLLIWILVAFIAALSQIPADAVVSGAEGMSDWALKPLWPFSGTEVVYALLPWGNVGVTIIFAIAMVLQAKFPMRLQSLAVLALIAVLIFIVAWGFGIHRPDILNRPPA